MTKKNKTALAVLCVVLALCVAALLILILLPKDGEKQSPVISFSSVYSMTFDGGTGTEYEYVNDGGVWRCALDSSIPLNQDVFDRISGFLNNLAPGSQMEISDSLEAYGLSAPAMTFSARDESGGAVSLLVGNPVGEEGYYAMENGGDKIYILASDFVDSINYSLFSLVEKEDIPLLSPEKLTGISLFFEGKSVSFTKEDDGWYMETVSGPVKEEDYSAPDSLGDSHTVRKYINDIENSLASMKADACVDYNGLVGGNWGIDTGLSAQFELDTGEVVTFFVGDSFRTDDTSQFFYFTLPGYSGVYAMPGAPGNALYEAMFALGTQSR